MLKRRPIDTYIRRATAGLPRLERVDTAAEIRVHLLQKTRELMAQGFPREEAEHLAVQEMGPVAATNRALIGHMFTSSLGWVVVGCMMLGAGVWTYLERDWIFWKDTTIRSVPLSSNDLQFALKQIPNFVKPPDFQKFEFVVPRGTRTVQFAIVSRFAHRSEVIFDMEDLEKRCAQFPSCEVSQLARTPVQVSVLLGEGRLKQPTQKIREGKLEYQHRGVALKIQTTAKIPEVSGGMTFETPIVWSTYLQTQDYETNSVGLYNDNSAPVNLNQWLPFWNTAIEREKVVRDLKGVVISRSSQYQQTNIVVMAIQTSEQSPNELKQHQLRVPSPNNTFPGLQSPEIEKVTKKDSMMFCPEKTLNFACTSLDTNSGGISDGASGRFGTLWW